MAMLPMENGWSSLWRRGSWGGCADWIRLGLAAWEEACPQLHPGFDHLRVRQTAPFVPLVPETHVSDLIPLCCCRCASYEVPRCSLALYGAVSHEQYGVPGRNTTPSPTKLEARRWVSATRPVFVVPVVSRRYPPGTSSTGLGVTPGGIPEPRRDPARWASKTVGAPLLESAGGVEVLCSVPRRRRTTRCQGLAATQAEVLLTGH